MTSTQTTRPLTPLERASVEPDNLARVLHDAVRRLSYAEPSNVADVAAQLNQFAMRLGRLPVECAGCGEATPAGILSRTRECPSCITAHLR